MSLTITQTSLIIDLPDEQMSLQIAERFAHVVFSPLVLGFSGEIGAGKTTFIRAMLRTLGIQGSIKSPTYTLIESYVANRLHIHHFDLYRIHEEFELEFLGFRDYFTNEALCCIEWPERFQSSFDCIDILLRLTSKGHGREMHMMAKSPRGEDVLSLFSGAFS